MPTGRHSASRLTRPRGPTSRRRFAGDGRFPPSKARSREIGRACPNRLDGSYNTIYYSSSGESMTMASEYTDEDFRNMFAGLMD